MNSPHIDLDPGSAAWTAYQALKNLALQMERWQASHNHLTIDDSGTLYHDIIHFIRGRLLNTSLWEQRDVEYLIQRSIGGLAILRELSEHDSPEAVELHKIVMVWINHLHGILCAVPEQRIQELLHEAPSTTIKGTPS